MATHTHSSFAAHTRTSHNCCITSSMCGKRHGEAATGLNPQVIKAHHHRSVKPGLIRPAQNVR
jgi:hypothetical protein